MSCVESCKRPAPNQAHCGSCHQLFNSVRPFDAHRVGGRCVPPESVGLAVNLRGAYSWPLTEQERARLANIS
jgi:hypothetical protein